MYGRKNISNDDDDKQQQRRPPASSAVSSTTNSNIGMYDAYNRSAAFSNSSGGGGNFNDSFRSPTPISIHDTFIGTEEGVGGGSVVGGPSTGRASDSSSLSRSDYDSGGNNEASEEASGE